MPHDSSVPITGSRNDRQQAAAANSVGITGQPTPTRLASIDIFRGLTMMIMIFVNDLGSVKGLPWWTYHAPAQVDVMTYVDMVFPAFLFIVGMAIPLAFKARLRRDSSEPKLWLHVILRTASLLVLGLILANAEQGNAHVMGIAPSWWAFTALIGAFLFWNSYSRNPKSQTLVRIAKVAGLAVLVAMFAIFRRTAPDGRVAWIDTSYWEILGIIGWAYLSVSILYIPTRRWRWAPFCWFLALLALNISSTGHWLRWPSSLPPYIWPFESGSSALIVMAGIVTTQIFSEVKSTSALRQKITWALVFACASLIAGRFLTPLGISKIRATPTWCLYSIASSILIYTLIYWIADVKGQTAWAAVLRPAGSNTLTTYLIPDLCYFALGGAAIEMPFQYGWPGVIRAIVFTFLMLGLAAVFTKAKIRLQL